MKRSVQLRRKRVYLQVPFREKDTAKDLGAWWDPDARKWYVPPGVSLWKFVGWLLPEEKAAVEDEMRREDERSRREEEWHRLEPRWTDPAVILSKLDQSPAYRENAFCAGCDSRFSGWYIDNIELRHFAHLDGTLRPSEHAILERALSDGLLERTKRRGFTWLKRGQK